MSEETKSSEKYHELKEVSPENWNDSDMCIPKFLYKDREKYNKFLFIVGLNDRHTFLYSFANSRLYDKHLLNIIFSYHSFGPIVPAFESWDFYEKNVVCCSSNLEMDFYDSKGNNVKSYTYLKKFTRSFISMIRSPQGFYGIDGFHRRILEVTPEGKFLKSYKTNISRMSKKKLVYHSAHMGLIFFSGETYGMIYAYDIQDNVPFWFGNIKQGIYTCAPRVTFNELNPEKIMFYIFECINHEWIYQTFLVTHKETEKDYGNKLTESEIQKNSDIAGLRDVKFSRVKIISFSRKNLILLCSVTGNTIKIIPLCHFSKYSSEIKINEKQKLLCFGFDDGYVYLSKEWFEIINI